MLTWKCFDHPLRFLFWSLVLGPGMIEDRVRIASLASRRFNLGQGNVAETMRIVDRRKR